MATVVAIFVGPDPFLDGASRMENGDYVGAPRIFVMAERDEPRNLDVKYKLAYCYLMLERWPEAERRFRAYTVKRSGDAHGHALLGFAVERQGRSDEAQDHYTVADSLSPGVLEELF